MVALRKLFDLYLQGSIHVALSVYSLIRITEIVLQLHPNLFVAGFGFFGTIVGYNFVKYDAIARNGKPSLGIKMKLFIAISMLAFIGTGWCFFYLEPMTQMISVIVSCITALYTLPFFPNRKNARSWAGLKIYMVALCWVGVTVILPVLNSGMLLNIDFFILCLKRFILVVVLLFIFEIIDLAWDDPHLKTVPQQIGVKRTKQLGIFLLFVFLLLEIFRVNKSGYEYVANIFLIGITAVFLLFANQSRSKYYTAFWVESIPIFTYLAIVFLALR